MPLQAKRVGFIMEHHEAFMRLRRQRVIARARRACVLVTGPASSVIPALAAELRRQLPCEVLVVSPNGTNDNPAAAGQLSFGAQLTLTRKPDDHDDDNAAGEIAGGGGAGGSSSRVGEGVAGGVAGGAAGGAASDGYSRGPASLDFTLDGGSAADCVLVAVDQQAGLMTHLGLAPVLTVAGVERGPALSSDIDGHPAVAAARQSGLLGVPAIAACLATPSQAAPMEPAVQATAALVRQAVACIQAGGGWPEATNFPRAHFPFPTRGRWALGREVTLPPSLQEEAAREWGEPLLEFASADCWALGDDPSWQGTAGLRDETPGRAAAAAGTGPGSGAAGAAPFLNESEAHAAVRQAFLEGDLVLCLDVPPTWKPPAPEPPGPSYGATAAAAAAGGATSKAFATTRPSVLWHCYQVAANHRHHDDGDDTATWEAAAAARDDGPGVGATGSQPSAGSSRTSIGSASNGNGSCSSSSSYGQDEGRETPSRTTDADWSSAPGSGPNPTKPLDPASDSQGTSAAGAWRTSWRTDDHDLYGRTLPSQGYGERQAASGAFVSQDNTRQVAERSRRQGAPLSSFSGSTAAAGGSGGGGGKDRSLHSGVSRSDSSPAGAGAGGSEAASEEAQGQGQNACRWQGRGAGGQLPTSFVISRGTLLNDPALKGDVEAVMGGRAAVTAVQTWPNGHPYCLTDALMVHALAEGPTGTPAWLQA